MIFRAAAIAQVNGILRCVPGKFLIGCCLADQLNIDDVLAQLCFYGGWRRKDLRRRDRCLQRDEDISRNKHQEAVTSNTRDERAHMEVGGIGGLLHDVTQQSLCDLS